MLARNWRTDGVYDADSATNTSCSFVHEMLIIDIWIVPIRLSQSVSTPRLVHTSTAARQKIHFYTSSTCLSSNGSLKLVPFKKLRNKLAASVGSSDHYAVWKGPKLFSDTSTHFSFFPIFQAWHVTGCNSDTSTARIDFNNSVPISQVQGINIWFFVSIL